MLILSPLEKALKSNKVNNEKLKKNGVFVYYCVKKFYADNFLGEFFCNFFNGFDSSIKFCDF